MIIVTGAYGFIASCLVKDLNQAGYTDLLLVDDFSKDGKQANLIGKKYSKKIERDKLFDFLTNEKPSIEMVFHLGARTDTTEFDTTIFDKLNIAYSKKIWNYCTKNQIPLLYASSAATYGDGELGYDDNHHLPYKLKPLNPYGESKNDFDKWVIQQDETPPNWYGMKFFNVFGPNEYHKGRMASVIFHAFNQINKTGGMKIFRSHKAEFEDGKQLRDFVYVKDVSKVMQYMMQRKPKSGLYNLGTGKARSFLDLTKATFKAMNQEEKISFIDIPMDIRDKYQYFTEANMKKLRDVGYREGFYSLEEAVLEYVQEYLMKDKCY
jgi:ADP-L-glycero-D-manno-heptose 6-epimerase